MKIKNVKIQELKPYSNNPKHHSKKQIKLIAESIKKFGMVTPILVDRYNNIIAGHARFEALKYLKKQTVSVVLIDNLTEEQVNAYRIADNKLAELGSWDERVLQEELNKILEQNINFINILGFENRELEDLLQQKDSVEFIEETIEEEKISNREERIVIKTGDLIELGEHKILCGDSSKKEDIQRILHEEQADLLITDPPYNVDYEGVAGKIANDNLKDEIFIQFLTNVLKNIQENLKPGGVFYIFFANNKGFEFYTAVRNSRLKLSQVLIWVKHSPVLSRQDYNWQHESILYGWKEGAEHFFCGDYSQTTVIEEKKPTKNKIHPTIKPIRLINLLINNSSKIGEIVLDVFGGSGTTLLACEATQRKARLIEIDPVFVHRAIDNFCRITKKERIKINNQEVSWEEYKNG